jgi:hypothetical protein
LYGYGGTSSNFAGRDIGRGFAKGNDNKEVSTKDLQGPLNNLKDSNEGQQERLKSWEESFNSELHTFRNARACWKRGGGVVHFVGSGLFSDEKAKS